MKRPGLPTFLVVVALLAQACGSQGTLSPSGPATGSRLESAPSASGPEPVAGGSAIPASPAPSVPDFAHVYVIVMENRSYAEIVGNSSAPYLNGLLAHH
ncbi:MAG: hypothetical protein M0Z49_16580, partial [Chloroflexi bacterium]|nr:hypothetical protein [Chloroflexota bacterium]